MFWTSSETEIQYVEEGMIELTGKYNSCKIFTDVLEESAKEQIQNYLNHPASEGTKIRIMPDVHGGAGCVIGFTSTLGSKIIPNLIGVDKMI